MRTWLALKPVVILAVVFALALLVNAGLVALDWSKFIIPPPEVTAEQLVGALGAHRYHGAAEQLGEELSKQVSEADLAALLERLEQSPLKGIQDAHGEQSEITGDQATATVRVKFGSNQEQVLSFPLQKENGLWQVTSLDALRRLVP